MKDLYIKAESLGFIPQNLSISWKEDPYLWLCELQRWLRDNHHINVNAYSEDYFSKEEIKRYYCYVHEIGNRSRHGLFASHEEAVIFGLSRALKLVLN